MTTATKSTTRLHMVDHVNGGEQDYNVRCTRDELIGRLTRVYHDYRREFRKDSLRMAVTIRENAITLHWHCADPRQSELLEIMAEVGTRPIRVLREVITGRREGQSDE